MKRLIFIFGFFLIASSLYSQKIRSNTTDKFTGSQIVQTSDVDISLNFWCSITKRDSVYILNLYFNGGKNIYTCEKDDLLLVKLNDGEIISLRNRKLVNSELIQNTINGVYYSHFTISPTYILDIKTINKLRNNQIETIRLKLSDKQVDGEVSARNAIKLMKLFNLFEI